MSIVTQGYGAGGGDGDIVVVTELEGTIEEVVLEGTIEEVTELTGTIEV